VPGNQILFVSSQTPVYTDIEALNKSFIEYLNIGGDPEAVFNPAIRSAPERFIKSDIIDKVPAPTLWHPGHSGAEPPGQDDR
jgi:hypothetical protein